MEKSEIKFFEEKFDFIPKDGDLLYIVACSFKFTIAFKDIKENQVLAYACYDKDYGQSYDEVYICDLEEVEEIRPMTQDEKDEFVYSLYSYKDGFKRAELLEQKIGKQLLKKRKSN